MGHDKHFQRNEKTKDVRMHYIVKCKNCFKELWFQFIYIVLECKLIFGVVKVTIQMHRDAVTRLRKGFAVISRPGLPDLANKNIGY